MSRGHSISMRGLTYQRLKDYCDAQKAGVSPTVEKWVTEDLDAKGVPYPEGAKESPKKTKKSEPKDDPEEIPDQHTTF